MSFSRQRCGHLAINIQYFRRFQIFQPQAFLPNTATSLEKHFNRMELWAELNAYATRLSRMPAVRKQVVKWEIAGAARMAQRTIIVIENPTKKQTRAAFSIAYNPLMISLCLSFRFNIYFYDNFTINAANDPHPTKRFSSKTTHTHSVLDMLDSNNTKIVEIHKHYFNRTAFPYFVLHILCAYEYISKFEGLLWRKYHILSEWNARTNTHRKRNNNIMCSFYENNLFIAFAVRCRAVVPFHCFPPNRCECVEVYGDECSNMRTHETRFAWRRIDFAINLFSFFYLLIARSDGLFVYWEPSFRSAHKIRPSSISMSAILLPFLP